MGLTTTELNSFNVIQPIPVVLMWGGIFAIFTLFSVSGLYGFSIYSKIFILFAVVFGVLFVFIVFWIYCFCLGGQNINKACAVTAIILCFTLVPTSLFLLFTPFINVFANSIGYMYYSLTSSELNNIFKFNIAHYNTDIFTPNKNVLLTLFNNEYTIGKDIDSFNSKYNDNDNPFKIDLDNDNNKLTRLVSGKNTIGILSWFYIATVFTSIISIKYLSTI